MRVAIVHSFYRTGPSGENRLVEQSAEALRDSGHEVRVFALHTDEESKKPFFELKVGVNVAVGLGVSPISDIEGFSPDVVHVHNLFPNWSDKWLEKLARPSVLTIHNFRTICAAGTLSREGTFCDLCPTKGSHNAVAFGCYQGSRVKSVPLALSSAKWRKKTALETVTRAIFLTRESFELHQLYLGESFPARTDVCANFVRGSHVNSLVKPDDRKGWIFVGRLAQEKGILELVERWPNHRNLRIIGSGPLISRIEALARQRPIELLGLLSPQQIEHELRLAEGLIFPSTWVEGGTPLVYLESLAAAVPVVALTGGYVGRHIRETGVGVAIDSLDELEDALQQVGTDWKKLSRRSQEVFESEFSEHVWVENMERIYRAAIEDFEENQSRANL